MALVASLMGASLAAPGRLTDEYLLRTYDVRELLAVGARYPATPLGVFERIEPSVARGFQPTSQGTLGSPRMQPAVAPSGQGAAMEADFLRRVRQAVGDQAWAPEGRGRAVIHEGRLCVWQRPQAHARIRTLLRRLQRRARTQLVIRVGVYVCTDEAAERIRRVLQVKDLEPVDPLLPQDVPPVKGALLAPDQIVTAVGLLNRTPGSQVLFSGTVACLPVRATALEDVRQVAFVSHLGREGSEPAAQMGVASWGAVLWLHPVPSADLKRVQVGVSARLAHLVGIERKGPIGQDTVTGPVHKPDLRTTALNMTLVVPSGQGVLVGGPPATIDGKDGAPVTGQLMCMLWPAVAPTAQERVAAASSASGRPTPLPAQDADELAVLKAALDRPFGLSLKEATLAKAIETLQRTGVRLDVLVKGDQATRSRFLQRTVTLVRRRTTLLEALGTLFGERLERVDLMPPNALRLHLAGGSESVEAKPAKQDEPIGLLTVRTHDGSVVTRLEVRRRDLPPELRARIEELLSEAFKNQTAGPD